MLTGMVLKLIKFLLPGKNFAVINEFSNWIAGCSEYARNVELRTIIWSFSPEFATLSVEYGVLGPANRGVLPLI